MFNCPGCWDNPCTCGQGYAHLTEQTRRELAAKLLDGLEEPTNPLVKKVTKTHVICPACKEPAGTIDHLLDSTQRALPGNWRWCCDNDDCGVRYEFLIGTDRQVKNVSVVDKPKAQVVYDMLVLPPQQKPVYLILKTKDYGHSKTEEEFRDQSFYYNEYTCPTNWTGNIERIIIEDDEDPHGLFEFVLRKTKEEVQAVGALDEDGDVNDGCGLIFMNEFLPSHLDEPKDMGMAEEVTPDLNPKPQQGLPWLSSRTPRLTQVQIDVLPVFSVDDGVDFKSLKSLVQDHFLYAQDLFKFEQFHDTLVNVQACGGEIKFQSLPIFTNINGQSGWGRLFVVQTGLKLIGMALALTEDFKVIHAVQPMSDIDLIAIMKQAKEQQG